MSRGKADRPQIRALSMNHFRRRMRFHTEALIPRRQARILVNAEYGYCAVKIGRIDTADRDIRMS
jgi:hypothetical protein